MIKRLLHRYCRFLLLLAAALFFTACPDNTVTPRRDTTIHLSLQSAGTFSVLLNVSVKDSSDAWTFALSRNDSIVQTVVSNQPDTTIRDGGLLPGQDYRYKAYWLDHGEKADSSEHVLATTMDTTSHNFTWEIDTLGNYGSYLNDVRIVDENNIWVVGYIKVEDSTYNVAHWDGNEWELTQLLYNGIVNEGKAIIYLDNFTLISAGTIFSSSDEVNWVQWTNVDLNTFPGGINTIWGSSPSDIWFVGDNGSIVHYDGSGFTRMESGTDVDLNNVVGTDDGQYVFSVGYDDSNGHSVILEKQDSEWNTLYYNESVVPQNGNMGAVYKGTDVLNDTVYFTTARGLWKYNYLKEKSSLLESEDFYNLMTYGAQGLNIQSPNDVLIGTSWARLIHFNGITWIMDNNVFNQFGPGNIICETMDRNEKTVVLVGHVWGPPSAFIARGYQQ